MAVELASAYVSLGANTKNLASDVRKAFGEIEGQAGKSSQTIGSKLSAGIATSLKAGMAAAGGAAAGAFGYTLKKGFDRLSAIEQAQAKLKGLGNSAEDVSKIMDNALGAVKGTAYGMGDAASVAASMVAAGIKPGKELETVLKTVGDTATIAGASMSDVGTIFGSVAARGKLQGDDMLQLLGRGVPVLQLLAEETGKTSAEVSDMVSKGEIDFKTFEAAMRRGMGGAALEAGNTFKGALDNANAAIGRLGEAILKGAFQAAPGVLKNLTDSIDGLTDKVKFAKEYFATGSTADWEKVFGSRDQLESFTGAIDTIQRKWGEFTAGLQGQGDTSTLFGNLGTSLGSIGRSFEAMWPSLERIGKALGEAGMTASIVSITSVLGALAPLLERVLVPVLEALAGLMESNQGAVTGLVTAFVGFKSLKFATGLLGGFGTKAAEVGGKVSKGAGALKLFGGALKDSWKYASQAAPGMSKLGRVMMIVKGNVAEAGRALLGMKGPLGFMARNLSKLGGLAATAGRFLTSGLASGLKAAATGVRLLGLAIAANPIGAIITAITAVIGALVWFFTQTETGKQIWASFMEFLSSAWQWIKDTAIAVWQGLGEFFSGLWNGIRETAVGLWQGLGEFLTGIWTWIKDTAVAVWDGIRIFFTGLWEGVKAVFTGVWQFLTGFLSWSWNNIVTVASTVWNGLTGFFSWLWEGIKTVFTTVWAAISSWITGAWNGFISFASGVWNNLVSLISGVWERIKATTTVVWEAIKSTVSALWNGMMDALRSGFDRVVGIVSGVKDRVLGALSGAGRWLVDTGRNIIEGLLNGMKSLLGKIGEMMLNMVPSWIREPFKKALDIHSPSRVFHGFGQNIGQGLINGIKAMGDKVESAAQGMADRVAGVDIPAPDVGAVDTSGMQVPVSVQAQPVDPATVQEGASAWQSAGQTVGATTTGVIDPAVQSATADVQLFGQNMQSTATGVVTPAWDQMAASVAASKTAVIDPAFAGVNAGLVGVGSQFGLTVNGAVVPTWNQMGMAISTVKTAVVDPAFAGINAGLGWVAQTFFDRVYVGINPVWSAMGQHIMNVKNGTIIPVFGAVQNGLDTLSGWFGTTVNNIGAAWDRMRAATARPARFVVETVMNNGIRNAWNAVAELIGEKQMNPVPLGSLGAYANGGVLPGYTPGRDPYTFVEPRTGMSIGLSGGEAIMRPEVTRALGTDRVDSLNAAARVGGVGAVKKTLGQFAGGGVVGSITGLVRKHFPMMTITSTYRNTNDNHGRGLAVDFSNGTDSTPEMRSAAQWFYQNYGKGLLELIHSPFNNNVKNGRNVGDGFGFYGAGTMNQHRNHVHVAAAQPLGAPSDPNFVLPGGMGGGFVAPSMEDIAKDAWDKEIKKIPKFTGGGGLFGGVPDKFKAKAENAAWGYLAKKARDSVGAAFTGSTGGAGVERWRGLVRHILKAKGLPLTLDNTTLRRMNQESGGNPRAINNWDVNAVNGTPSKGLMQVIDPTFRANADPGFNTDIWDPESNIRASMNYALRRYGSLPAAYDRAGGYDSGGYLQPGVTRVQNDSGKPEPVFSHSQWQTIKASMWSKAQAGDFRGLVEELGNLAGALRDVVAKVDWRDIGAKTSTTFNEKFREGQLADIRSVFGLPDYESIPFVKAQKELEDARKQSADSAASSAQSADSAAVSADRAEAASQGAPMPVAASLVSSPVDVGAEIAKTGSLVAAAVAAPNPATVGAAALGAGQTINFIVQNQEAAMQEFRKFQAKNNRGLVGAR